MSHRSCGCVLTYASVIRVCPWRCGTADLVRYQLDADTAVYFEASEGSLVSLRGGVEPHVVEGGALGDRLQDVARAAEQVAESLRSRLQPDEVQLEFGVKIAGEVNWWFFSKTKGEGNLAVTLTWNKPDRAS